MFEFLWFVILIANLVGLSFARAKRKSATAPQAQHDHGPPDRAAVWSGRFSPAELRWWLVIGILIAAAFYYFGRHEPMRIGLNLLLFFEWHAVLVWALLALSVAGFILAWRNELTRGAVVRTGLIGSVLALLFYFEWYCLIVILLTLGLLPVLWAWRDHFGGWAWLASWLILFLTASLFLSHVFPRSRPDARHYIEFALVLAATLLGMLWSWRRRARLLALTSAILAGVLIVGLILAMTGHNVPQQLDAVNDWVLIGLGIVLVVVTAKVIRCAHLQPLGWLSAVMVVFLGSGLFLSSILYGMPEDFADIEDQFKYGSIGSDNLFTRGMPYYIWQVLPVKFPPEEILMNTILPAEGVRREDYAPRYSKADGQRGNSFEALGLLKEENKRVRLVGQDTDTLIDRPIGFSKRKVFGLDFIGMNCAFCHTSTIRTAAQSDPHIVSGMPANTVDIELYFLFLFGAVEQKEFKSGPMMTKILTCNDQLKLGRQFETRGLGGLCQEINNSFHRLAYRLLLIPLTQKYVKDLKKKFDFIDPKNPDSFPRSGPGRVDAWSPGKRTLIDPPLPVVYPGGIIDYMAIWNQKARSRFHWDGNTYDIHERNIIAGLVVNGPQIEGLDVKRVQRITDWIMERPAPRFDDFAPTKASDYNSLVLADGKRLYQQWCASCHAPNGERIGRIEPLDTRELNTDPARMRAFTVELQNKLNTITRESIYPQQRWQLREFRIQNGYLNTLLDGIWLRAPYLHNGSVPTLRDLLNLPCDGLGKRHCRPVTFYRGQDIYDWKNLGFTLRIEPGDTLDVVVRGQAVGRPKPVDKAGMVTNSGVEGLDGKVWGLSADEVALQIDQKQRVTEKAIQEVLKGQPLTFEEAVTFLQRIVKLSPTETKKVLYEVKDKKSLTPADAEKVLRAGFARNPLVAVQIQKKGVFAFNTQLLGNSNEGHLYGTDLTDNEKDSLIEFLKTL